MRHGSGASEPMATGQIAINLAEEAITHLRHYAQMRGESLEQYLERWVGSLANSPIDEILDRIKSQPITDPDPLLQWWAAARTTDLALPLKQWLFCLNCGNVNRFLLAGPAACPDCEVVSERVPYFLHHSYERLIGAMEHCAPAIGLTLNQIDDPFYKRGTVGMLAAVLFSTLNERLLEAYLSTGFKLTRVPDDYANLLLQEFDSIAKRVDKLVPLVARGKLRDIAASLVLGDGRTGTDIITFSRSVADQRNAFLHEAKEPPDWTLPLKCMKEASGLLEFYALLHNATLSRAVLLGPHKAQ